jgi:hypothetical protein
MGSTDPITTIFRCAILMLGWGIGEYWILGGATVECGRRTSAKMCRKLSLVAVYESDHSSTSKYRSGGNIGTRSSEYWDKYLQIDLLSGMITCY